MERDAFDAAMRAATEEILGLDREIASLEHRRKALLVYVEATRRLLDGNVGFGSAPKERASLGTAPVKTDDASVMDGARSTVVKRDVTDALPRAEASRVRSIRRRFMQDAVATVVDTLRRSGKPMTTEELHAAHPQRDDVNAELLYKTLHKRIERGRVLDFDRGYFWLREPWPENWIHPRGPRPSKRQE